MTDPLSTEEFETLVATYGAKLERWPEDLRHGAVRCLVESDTARSIWIEADALDDALDDVQPLETSPALFANIEAIAAAPTGQPRTGSSGTFPSFLPYALAASIALIVGIALPSPFNTSSTVPVPVETAISQPETTSDLVNGLTTLALVDIRTVGDEQGETDSTADDVNLLSDLALH